MPIPKGFKHSKETKRKMSETRKLIGCGKWNLGKKYPPRTEEHKRKIAESLIGKKLSAETRLKISKIQIGKRLGEDNPSWKGGISKDWGHYRRARRNRERNADGSHTRQEWIALKTKCLFMCLCCKKQEPEIILTEDHIIPLIKGGSDNIENIQPLCRSCNSRKSIKTIDFNDLIPFKFEQAITV